MFELGDTLFPSFDHIEVFPRVASSLSFLCFALAINDIVTAVPDGVSCSLYVDNFFYILEWLDFIVCSPSDAVGDK